MHQIFPDAEVRVKPMQINRYPLWKYIMLVVVIIVGLLYALPNLYGEDPAVQITGVRGVA
ncbi:hypothetical protein MJL79_29470, partial [Salmonella enterica subsp. enterica serovar Montevideo]|nr:hypothetical protein [Salmonella enterica subsp. enterica serovar Montevideo]